MMRKSNILHLAFATILALGILHFLAGAFYLYWTLGWFDYLMHFLGGLGGGLVAFWFVSNKNFSQLRFLVIIVVSVLLVGVAWEIFEYAYNIAQSTEGYVADTFHDLLMDALGALVAWRVGYKKIRNDRN